MALVHGNSGHCGGGGALAVALYAIAAAFRIVPLAVGLLVLGAAGGIVHALENRLAVVVGNANYKDAAPLATPVNDAEDIAAALTGIGFDVVTLKNAGGEELRQALRTLTEKSAKADISIVYFAGHSVEFAGEIYLVPADAEFTTGTALRKETIALRTATLSVARSRSLGLVIMDASRKNSFLAKMGDQRREAETAMGPPETFRNVLMFTAAETGKTVEESAGRNSPMATALLRYMAEPTLEISFLFRNVRDEVRKSTSNKQTPYMYGQLSRGKIFLNAAPDPKRNLVALARPADASSLRIHPCDVQATSPADVERVQLVKGVRNEDIKPEEARAACVEATKQYPGVSRFHYQLGRAAFAGKDYTVALSSYRKAVELGNDLALHALGLMYEEGTGVGKDPGRARFYYELAAEKNSAPAMVNLGMQYERGAGVGADPAKAYEYYKRAGDLGHARAINNLGQFNERGLVVPQNAAQARVLYEKSAALGDEVAMINLARLYGMGLGVRKDLDKAKHWLNLAKQAGSAEAPRMLRELEKPRRR